LRIFEEESETPLWDVKRDAVEFNYQVGALQELDLPFPCLAIAGSDTPLPVFLGITPEFGRVFPRAPAVLKWGAAQVANFLQGFFNDEDETGISGTTKIRVKPEEARGFFQRRLSSFLQARLAGSATNTPVGLQFQVTTDTRGLTAYFSQVHVFRNNQAFGYPTYPVTGYVQPGVYYFGAGPAGNPTWDMLTTYDTNVVRAAHVAV
jgi:hypothetical protein